MKRHTKTWKKAKLVTISHCTCIHKIADPSHKKKKKPTKWLAAAAAKSLQSCPTLCDPTDSSPAGSPVPGTLQARTLEWVAISFSNA